MKSGHRIPQGITFNAAEGAFRHVDGTRMGAEFERRWFAHRAEFPQVTLTGDFDDRQQALVEALMPAKAKAKAKAEAEPLSAAEALDAFEASLIRAYDQGNATDPAETWVEPDNGDKVELPLASGSTKSIHEAKLDAAVLARPVNEFKKGERMAELDSAPKDHNPKTAAGRAKPAMEFVPPVAMMHLAEVMRGGAAKYGAFNWRDAAVSETTYYSAAHRHLAAWFDGQEMDPESGQQHLAHVMACCAILLDAGACGALHHDRPKAGNAAGVMQMLAAIRQG